MRSLMHVSAAYARKHDAGKHMVLGYLAATLLQNVVCCVFSLDGAVSRTGPDALLSAANVSTPACTCFSLQVCNIHKMCSQVCTR